MLAIPEVQFLAYVHNAEDQIRGEAATLPFFSRGKFANPMVIRLPGLAYQKGFGGHFHNDNSLAVFRDIPGVMIACPSNGRDAAAMLRTCVAEAWQNGRVVCFVEPIALYHTRDLHETGDGLYATVYQPPSAGSGITPGQVAVHGSGTDLCILTYGNGVFLSLQAEKLLRQRHELQIRIVDLRWLAPLPRDSILEAVADCRNVLIVDECRRSGSVSEALITLLHEAGIYVPVERITAEDSFVPLGAAAELVLPSCDRIVEHAQALVRR
jgi:2-oxoisovalerate dehydrogenase E1 component